MEPKKAIGHRTERDPIGEKKVPLDVLYGIQTLRALENFQISSLRVDYDLIIAFAEIKKAAAKAHLELGDLLQLIKPHSEKMREYAEKSVEWPRFITRNEVSWALLSWRRKRRNREECQGSC